MSNGGIISELFEVCYVVRFVDGSVLEIPRAYVECVKQKYGLSWEEYWEVAEKEIDKLWENRMVLTKWGIEPLEDVFEDSGSVTRAEHAKICIYADLRCCLIALILNSLFPDKEVEVVGVNDDGEINVYDGKEVRRTSSLEEFFEDEDGDGDD